MDDFVYISLGGNIGEREKWLTNALNEIYRRDGIQLTAISSLYDTEPWGMSAQPNFLNAVVEVKFSGEPHRLLDILQEIENTLGRERRGIWAPRTVDLDILLFGKQILDTARLTIPHRYLLLRDFFLVPLIEISPNVVHPISGAKLSDYERRLPPQLRTIKARKEVELWQDTITSLLKDR